LKSGTKLTNYVSEIVTVGQLFTIRVCCLASEELETRKRKVSSDRAGNNVQIITPVSAKVGTGCDRLVDILDQQIAKMVATSNFGTQ
jgi:hypothetical protein